MGITDKLPLLNSKSKIVKIIGYVLYAFVILMIIGAMAPAPSDDRETSKTTEIESSQAAERQEESDNLTEEDVEDLVGGQKSIAVSDDGYVVIMRPDEEYWSLISIESDTTDMFKKLFEDQRVTSARISTYLKGIDEYGNEGTTRGASFTMTKETASRINWDNFLYSNLPDVADDAYINPKLFED